LIQRDWPWGTSPKCPGTKMSGMRNILIHQYGDVDLELVWDTLQTDLVALVAALEATLGEEAQ